MKPALEIIAEDIDSTLAGITETNGYDYTLSVERAKKKNEIEHLKAVIHQTAATNTTPDGQVSDERSATFVVVAYVLPENDNDDYDTINRYLAAAIELELLKDHTRGNNAIDTIIGDVVNMPGDDGEFGGFSLQFTVNYRYQFGQPFVEEEGQ